MFTSLPPALAGRPFTTAEALSCGLTPRMLQHPRFTRLTTGVWTAEADPRLALQVAGALKILPPRTYATGVTGLRLHGVDVGSDQPLRFVSYHPWRVRRDGLRVSTVNVIPANNGYVLDPEHCFADATELGLVDLVSSGDSLVRLGRLHPDILSTAMVPGRRGVRLARRAASLVRLRVDSPRETELRLVLVLAGLPDPAPNLDVGDNDRWLGRGDLVFAEYGVIVEYDGLQHLTDRAQWERDIVRLEDLARAGWVVIRVSAARLRHPAALVDDVAAALTRGGWAGQPQLTAEWHRAFASRQ